MNLFDKIKLGKIKKFEAAKNSAGIIKLLTKINDSSASDVALEALGRIGDSLAINELKNRFNKLYVNDNLDAEKYIKILKSSGNQEAYDFIRGIYKNDFYQNNPICMFHSLALSALIDIGDINILMENIDTLQYNNVGPAEQEAICQHIRENINDEKMLLRIISESKVHAFCREALAKIKDINQAPEDILIKILHNKTITKDIILLINNEKLLLKILSETKINAVCYEALKKIKDINKIPEQILEEIICNRAITEAILPRINDTKLLLKILAKAKGQYTIYPIFDMLLKEIGRRGVDVSLTANKVKCPSCEGKGSYKSPSDFDSDFGNMYHLVDCSVCKKTGKIIGNDISIEHDGLKIGLMVYRIKKNEIYDII